MHCYWVIYFSIGKYLSFYIGGVFVKNIGFPFNRFMIFSSIALSKGLPYYIMLFFLSTIQNIGINLMLNI